jgi:elongation factor 1-gamma
MVFKIYGNKNADLYKALITAKYYGINLEVADADTSKNPAGKVPTLETADGVIYESNAIVRHIARVGGDKAALYGKTAFEAGLIDQWIEFAATSIDLPALAWTLPIEGLIPNNGLATKKAGEDIKKVFQVLDSHLLTRTYLVGNRVSLADIVVANSLVRLFELVLDPAFRAGFVNATRWFNTIVNQPNFVAVRGNITLADKVAQPAKQEKEKKEKAPAAPKEEKPKQEKPKKQEKPAAEEEEEEEGEKEERKKNPLDDLPKSNFVMDEWKRVYSNNDTRSVAIPWFHEKYDPAGFCAFWADYKYNDEIANDPSYKVNNLIGGFYQRLEKLHKYAFGTMNIYGEQGSFEIHGVWVFRGADVPPDMKECDDSEVYEWKRADFSDAAQKAKFDDYIAWEGEVNGKKFNSGKVFK